MDFEQLEQYREEITNVYKCYNERKVLLAYFYAQKKKSGLGFEYHILRKDQNGNFVVVDPQNTLEMLQESNYDLEPVKKESDDYEIFVDYLATTINNEKRR